MTLADTRTATLTNAGYTIVIATITPKEET